MGFWHTLIQILSADTHNKKKEGGWKGKTTYTIWVIPVQKSYVPNAGIRGWGSVVPSSYLQGLNIFTVLMIQCLKLVLFCFFPLKMTLQMKHVFHPSLSREKKKKKEKPVICSMLDYSCLFFLTLFKPKPCVRCDFHVVIIFMAPMSCAASLHQTSFWTLRAHQLGVEQSCA